MLQTTKGATSAPPATTQSTSERFASSSGVRTTAARVSGLTMPDTAEHNPPSAHPVNAIPPTRDAHLDCLQQGKPSAVLGYTETDRADHQCANASKPSSMQQVVSVGHGREQATPSTDTSSQVNLCRILWGICIRDWSNICGINLPPPPAGSQSG